MLTLTEVLDELGIPYRRAGEHHHIRGDWIGVDCPLCGPGSGSFKLGLKGRAASCWNCGPQNQAWMLHLLSSNPYPKVLELLKATGSHARPPGIKPRGKLVLPQGLLPLQPLHRNYLKSRGLDPDEMEQVWGFKGFALHPQLAWRVFIPITLRGKTVSWTTRATGDHPLRYISAAADQEAVPRNEVLFGEDFVHHTVLVVEGPLDAVRIGPGAAATLGVKYSQAQLLCIARFPVRLICYDQEPAAQKQAARLCRELAAFPGVTRQVVLNSKDPGSCTGKELRELRRMLV